MSKRKNPAPRRSRPARRAVKQARPKPLRAARAARPAAKPAGRQKAQPGRAGAHSAPRPKKKQSPTTRAAAGSRTRHSQVQPKRSSSPAVQKAVRKKPRLDRERRVLQEPIPTPPSSLDMDRRGSAVRTGRAEMAQLRRNLGAMTPLAAGDPDADAAQAYFSGEEAPGGDNPTPDQDVVDEIGRALGVQYQDNEELQGADKVLERDRHRWELDPASAEDYKDRK